MSNNNYLKAIEKYGYYIATPIGISMLPLLRERRDTVKLVAVKTLKVGDVILYERTNGTFVLHRIMKIKDNTYTMCGDHQCKLEKGIKKEQVIAIMEGFYRDEKYIASDNPEYLKYVEKIIKTRKWRYLKYTITRPLVYIYKQLRRK